MGWRVVMVNSGRLLQSDQSAIWLHYRVLLAAVMSRDESYRWVSLAPLSFRAAIYWLEQIWVPLARLRKLQTTNQNVRSGIHRAPHGLDTGQYWQWADVSQPNRYPLPSSPISLSIINILIRRNTGVPFPKTFPSLIRQMFKRLYRVYAHIYCHHYHVILKLGLEPHLNTSFKHYVLFIDEHNLASGKDFWGPLGDLVESMLKSD